jgi:hypothetical protein
MADPVDDDGVSPLNPRVRVSVFVRIRSKTAFALDINVRL